MTRRLVAGAVSLVIAMLVVLGVPFLRTVERYERERLRLDLTRDAVVLGANVEDQLSASEPADAFTASVVTTYAERTSARVVIVDKQGLIFADSASTSDTGDDPRSMATRPEIVQALNGNFAAVTRHSTTLGYSSLYVAVPVSSAGRLLGAVRVSFPTRYVDQRIALQRTRLIGFGAVAALVVGLTGAWLARWVTRPLNELRHATKVFGETALTHRAPIGKGPNDIRLLAAEFNDMAERLESFVTTQNAFVADASHELRTPLTALRLQLETMEFANPETLQARRRRALDEVNRLSRNVDGLLVLGRQQAPQKPVDVIDIADLVQARAAFWQTLIDENNLSLVTDTNRELPARVVPDRLGTALDNLIANAIDAAPAASTITIRTRAIPDHVEIHVLDTGPGMTEPQRDAAFDRFWRATENNKPGGSGLGLAIARKLVTADRGTIRLNANQPHGIDATITYPNPRTR